jgi:hydroxymethylglutaryl-CoA lyase
MTTKEKVRIIEVGPRDGLQNEKTILDVADKITLIQMLIDANIKELEFTSFVSPQKIPQMGDSLVLATKLSKELLQNDLRLLALVPNLIGLQNLLTTKIKNIAVFTATSESFNKKNINASIDESLVKIKEVTDIGIASKLNIRGYISTVFGCPYEGKTSIDSLKKILSFLFAQGCYEISLGDTIGIANPEQVRSLIQELKKDFDLKKIVLHFHDTRGMALSNIYAGYLEGIRAFDSSAGGLGGCPYAKGATGNIATEDVVNFFHSQNIDTGIDMKKLVAASQFIFQKLGREVSSKYHQAYIKSGY